MLSLVPLPITLPHSIFSLDFPISDSLIKITAPFVMKGAVVVF